VSFFTSYNVLTSCTKLEKSNERISRYRSKCLLLGQNCPIYPDLGKTRIFGQQGLVSYSTSYNALTSCTELEKSNERILRYRPKCLFWAQICPIYPNFGQIRIFVKNPAPSLFSIYGCLAPCKKSGKNNEPIQRKRNNERTNGRTNGRTDGRTGLNL